MKDYETLRIPNGNKPYMGLLNLTVSERRVGLHLSVLDALGRPNGIVIHRGIRANEGRLIVEAVEFDEDDPNDEVIYIDYKRKKVDFFSREFVEVCKDMVREYASGEFSKGVFYTVKGVQESETTVMFNFRIASSRRVKSATKPKKRGTNGKITGNRSTGPSYRKKDEEARVSTGSGSAGSLTKHGIPAQEYNVGNVQNQAFSGFSIPSMTRNF